MPSPNAETLLRRFVVKAKFRHIQVLTKLSELGSMRRTAEAVNMTQPAVSQLVADLENLLETPLFFRHARGVEPTQVTRDLLPIALRILSALEDGSEAIANRVMENQGIVRISATSAGIGSLLHGRLHGFALQHPSIQLLVTEFAGNDPIAGLGATPADIVCTRSPAVLPEGWVFDECCPDSLIAICGITHPFAKMGAVPPETLREGKWLLNRVGSASRIRFEGIAATYQFPKDARCQIVQHVPTLSQNLLETGAYLAVCPKSVAEPWIQRGTVVELDTVVTRDLPPLGILWRSDEANMSVTRVATYLKSQPKTTRETPLKIVNTG
jgi:DNA-binding transcriptional LysR family regulator